MVVCHLQPAFLGIVLYTFCRHHHSILPQRCWTLHHRYGEFVSVWLLKPQAANFGAADILLMHDLVNSEDSDKDDEDFGGEKAVCTANGCCSFSRSKWWMNVNFCTVTKTQNQRSTRTFPLWLPTTNEFNWSEVNRTEKNLTELKWSEQNWI